jgi:hypothetical protein
MPEQDLSVCRFGVNYTPSRRWYYMWNDFDAKAIARDLDAVASLGADHIRLMLIWPWFQPNIGWVSPVHLERLGVVFDFAAQRGLDVCPSLLCGWLTGGAFRQTFERKESIYDSPRLWESQRLYFREVAAMVKDRPNFIGFDLGNEMNCCWYAKPQIGDAWMERAMAELEALSPLPHVNGVDHNPWFMPHTFSPRMLATRQQIVALHSWVFFTGALQRGGLLDPVCVKLGAAMAALARSYAGDPAKPMWLQEYGCSEAWAEPRLIPDFLEHATEAGIRGGITRFTWWASHDIDRAFDMDELEYSLGLFDVNNRIKPAGEAMRRVIAQHRNRRVDLARLAPPPPPPPRHEYDATWRWLESWIANHA